MELIHKGENVYRLVVDDQVVGQIDIGQVTFLSNLKHIALVKQLNDRAIKWAAKRKTNFGTKDVVHKFKVSRAHASMLLSRLAAGPYPIKRVRRGVYRATSGTSVR